MSKSRRAGANLGKLLTGLCLDVCAVLRALAAASRALLHLKQQPQHIALSTKLPNRALIRQGAIPGCRWWLHVRTHLLAFLFPFLFLFYLRSRTTRHSSR